MAKNNIKEAFENGKDDFECLSDREKFLIALFTCSALIKKEIEQYIE